MEVFISETEIEHVTVHKLFGLTFDSRLQWKHYTDSTCRKVVKRLTLIRYIKPFLQHHARIRYYTTMVATVMEYACVIWSDASQHVTKRILKLQKLDARIILDIKCPTDVSTEYCLFQKLNWMTFLSKYNTIGP